VSGLYLYDDAAAREFEPFALTRPVSELRAGTDLIRERWERVTGLKATAFLSAAHLEWFAEAGAPPAAASSLVIPAGNIVANSRFVPSPTAGKVEKSARAGDKVCAVRIAKDVPLSEFANGKLALESLAADDSLDEIEGRWISAVWQLISTLADQLREDIPALAAALKLQMHSAEVFGGGNVFIEEGARIDPFVAFDTSAGPILVRNGATVSAFSRLVGPLYIGEHATVMGDYISSCSIGEWCKVRGEMSNTIMLGHSNKGHAGFVGHSYLGRWVNLGSGTTTSNLKNTYGTVQVWTPAGMVDTGMQFLGTLFGDHAKTGIGMMLTTGSVIGAGANIFGTMMPPKAVAPFSWGDAEPYSTFEEEKFLAVAERVMSRRHVELDEKGRRHLKSCYARRWS
jgi:UDP-N-acetylglucosamine diphosphorylase / glucose-1-phosphate thymidylyltransferase / UDP-N-acetylgalactosamine diphosphorylase / glucosamine-1-phosphate N-acetyltransferase / galactosamine-1-phosphate N-acetyltransferase